MADRDRYLDYAHAIVPVCLMCLSSGVSHDHQDEYFLFLAHDLTFEIPYAIAGNNGPVVSARVLCYHAYWHLILIFNEKDHLKIKML